MNKDQYLNLNRAVYLKALQSNETNHLAVNWGSQSSQIKRFEILSGISEDIFESSILDVGCGIGHFSDFIKAEGFKGSYNGIDVLPEMVEKARTRHPDLNFEVKQIEDFTDGCFDYLMMSGIFTVADYDIFQALIPEAFRVCQKGIAFNMLSHWAPIKEDAEFYANPIKIMEFCSQLTTKIVLRHDYLPHDFTIHMYKV